MQTCKICNKPIGHNHGNTKYCKRHQKHLFKPIPRVQMVSMTYDDYLRLKADSEELKRIKGDV